MLCPEVAPREGEGHRLSLSSARPQPGPEHPRTHSAGAKPRDGGSEPGGPTSRSRPSESDTAAAPLGLGFDSAHGDCSRKPLFLGGSDQRNKCCMY